MRTGSLRPTVAAEFNTLYLGIVPVLPAKFFAATNNNQLAVVALDEQGQPRKLRKAFRPDLRVSKDYTEDPRAL